MGCMANLHTTLSVNAAALHSTLNSQSEVSFLIPLRIPGIPDPITALIDSGATSSFINLSLASLSIFVPTVLAQPIALCLFDSKPAMSGFIHQSISTPVQFSDDSSQTLNLLVTRLHPSAPVVLGLPWLRSTNPVIDWTTLSLTFQTDPKLSLPEIALTLSCTTSAPHHEDIVSNLSPMFA